MNTRFLLLLISAVALFLAGCPQKIVIESKPVYKEVLVEISEEPADLPQTAAPIVITFDDLHLNLKLDVPFEEKMLTDRVKALEGKRVRVSGVMHGGVDKPKDLNFFVLLRNKEYGGGWLHPADHLIEVKMQAGETVNYTAKTVQVEGILRIKPQTGADGNTWSLYILEEATVPPRLQFKE